MTQQSPQGLHCCWLSFSVSDNVLLSGCNARVLPFVGLSVLVVSEAVYWQAFVAPNLHDNHVFLQNVVCNLIQTWRACALPFTVPSSRPMSCVSGCEPAIYAQAGDGVVCCVTVPFWTADAGPLLHTYITRCVHCRRVNTLRCCCAVQGPTCPTGTCGRSSSRRQTCGQQTSTAPTSQGCQCRLQARWIMSPPWLSP